MVTHSNHGVEELLSQRVSRSLWLNHNDISSAGRLMSTSRGLKVDSALIDDDKADTLRRQLLKAIAR
jgi:hypothetical protein